MASFDPSKFTTHKAKQLPVILLLDISGSMSGRKIDELNRAVKEMLASFVKEERMEHEVLVSIITFGDVARLHSPPARASAVKFVDMTADGSTPLAAALGIVKDLVEDRSRIPSRAYRPTIILVSDGQPTDEQGRASDNWIAPLDALVSSGRSSKCDRMAMAIGDDADENVLSRFVRGTPHQIFYARNAPQLHEFFQRLTMTISLRAASQDPDVIPQDSDVVLDGRTVPPPVDPDGSAGQNTGTGSQPVDDEGGYW